MQKFENIGDWVKKKYGGQRQAAKALDTSQGVVSQWINGRSVPLPEMQALMVKNGYNGPFPEPKKKTGKGVSAEVFAEYRGEVKTEIRNLRQDLEDTGEAVRFLLSLVPEESRPKGLSKRFR